MLAACAPIMPPLVSRLRSAFLTGGCGSALYVRPLSRMSQLFRTTVWQVVLPDKWQAGTGETDELVKLWNPEGVGSLTVISRADNNPPPRDSRAKDFCGKLQGKALEFSGGSSFARHWSLLCGGQWIYIRYSCAAQNSEIERGDVDAILRNISEAV